MLKNLKICVDASAIEASLARYSFLEQERLGPEAELPVRVCVYAPSQSEIGPDCTKQDLVLAARGRIEAETRLRHDPEADFHLQLHLRRAGGDAFVASEAALLRQPVQLVGAYFKRSRQVSQTPMFVEASGGKKVRVGTSSVEEALFEAVKPEFFGEGRDGKVVLASAGREDVDVKVLGRGRLFMLTIHDPRKNVPLLREGQEQAQRTLCGAIQAKVREISQGLVLVQSLRFASADDRTEVLEGGEKRRKVYACVLELERPLDPGDETTVWNVKDLVIQQKTPIRVSHRRAMMTREKQILELSVVRVNNTHLVAYLFTSAGLYIKEFVHGDLGRTTPTLCEAIGIAAPNRARMVSLDVLGSAPEADVSSLDAFLDSDGFVW